MARRIGSKVKTSRRYGVALHPKAERALVKRNYPPGQHGPQGRGRMTNYGEQLAEKQKAKLSYGVLERQFRRYYAEAVRRTGSNSLNLLQLLEMRLDNVVFRLGFASTRDQARQMVNHAHMLVNGKKVDIPSYQVSIGDVVGISPRAAKSKLFANLDEKLKGKETPSWLALQADLLSGKVLDKPTQDDIQPLFDPKVVIEFYSR